MKRLIATLLLALLPALLSADQLSVVTYSTSGSSGTAFTGGDLSAQFNSCGPDSLTNVEMGSCTNDANAGTGGTSTAVGNAANGGNGAGNTVIGSTASVGGSGGANVVIGVGASAAANNGVTIGGTATGATQGVTLGFAAVGAPGSFVAGAVTIPLERVRFIGSAPVLSACGTSPSVVTGSTTAGKLTTGSGASLQSCTLTFPTAWTVAPSCVANNETAIVLLRTTTTTTTLVIDAAVAGTMESDVISYICLGGS